MQYSDVAKLQTATAGGDRPKVADYYGRVRVACIDTTLTAADTKVLLVKLPAGRIRILSSSRVTGGLATTATTIKIGYPAYTKVDGTTQTADDDALMSATASASVSGKALNDVVLESSSGVDIEATLSANGAANDTIKGFIQFVVD